MKSRFTEEQIINILGEAQAGTRDSIKIAVDTSLSGRRVCEELEQVIEMRGNPDRIISDNGTEFTSMAIVRSCQEQGIRWDYIQPGSP